MTEFYSEDGSVDEFALPGDEAIMAQLGAEQPAAEEPVAEQPAAEAERPRDEQGRFAKQEQEEPAAEEPEEQPEPELILGKFKTADDLAAAYQELESLKGRKDSEIGELRAALEQRLEAMDRRIQQPITPQTPVTQDLIDSNPAAAAELAYQQGNQAALAAAFEAWEMEAPTRAAAWVAQKQIEQANAQWAQKFEELEQRFQPIQQQTTQNELHSGVARLREQYPDIGDFIQTSEFAELAEKIPLAKKAIAEGTPDEVVSAIQVVYEIHRGRASDNLKDTAREVARTAAEEAQAMREEAFVASASATTTAPPRSRADDLAAGWDDTDRLFDNGWNV